MLTASPRVREGMLWFKSGHFYSFYYKKYANDPIPTVVMLNWVHGTHPNTGHIHNYIQAINLSYIPRNFRKKFVHMWLPTLRANGGNVRLTWEKVVARWPFLTIAVRRYLLKRNYIKYARLIPEDKVEEEVISTWTRDYSVSAMKQFAIMTDRARERNHSYHRNLFAKKLAEYLYKYKTAMR